MSTQSNTLDEVRSVLGLDWASAAALSYWRRILTQDEPTEGEVDLPIGAVPSEAVRRVRSILNEMYCVHASGETRHPALLHLEGDPISQLVSRITARSKDQGTSFEALWTALSQLWLSNDHRDAAGFRSAGLKSGAILGSDRSVGARQWVLHWTA